MASFPEGTSPETAIACGPVGSLLDTVMIPLLGPKLLGWNLMGISIEPPGSMVTGYESTSGTRKSGDEEEMPVTVRVHAPVLANVSGSSLKEPWQQLPKLPLSAMSKARCGGGAKPETETVTGPLRLLLNRVTVAFF